MSSREAKWRAALATGWLLAYARPWRGAIAGITLLNIAIAVWIDSCLRFPESRVGRMLNARPIAFVGVLSYSIYLWQQPFLREGNGLRVPSSGAELAESESDTLCDRGAGRNRTGE